MKTLKSILLYLLLGILALSVCIIVPNLKRDVPVEDLKPQYANEASQFVDIEGIEVHYRDEGSGVPIVLLHGTGASLHTWDGWAKGLTDNYRVIRMDLPGFGLTGPDADADYSVPYYSQFLSKFLNKFGIEKCILGGNSLGGYISWYFATQQPDRVQSLVLVDPSGINIGDWEPLVLKLARTPLINGLLTHATPRSFIRKNLEEVYYDDSKISDELVERYYLMALREGNREAFVVRAHTRMDVDYSQLLPQITAPTLILWGKQDAWSPAELGTHFEELIPNAQLAILPEAGHVPMEEVPERSLVVVEEFLLDVEGWTSLWNGRDLQGWGTFLNTPYQKREDDTGHPLAPFGIDNDPEGVMSVVSLEDGPAIRISGVTWGTIHTNKDYGNYHLKLQVKWGDAMHSPRENGPRDSGLLYHGFGRPGEYNPWMSSQELQIQQGDMGDYWPTGDVEIDVPSVAWQEGYFKYQEGAQLRTYVFADIDPNQPDVGLSKRRVFKATDAERNHGQWNDVELITWGDSSIHIVNGEVVMRLYNSRVASTQQPLTKGKIVLQSEGAEVFYKDIFLRQIHAIPSAYKEVP